MNDIRERLALAIGGVTNVNFEDPESPSCKIAFFEADAALAQLPLTQAQLDGLASGDMVVVDERVARMAGVCVMRNLGFGERDIDLYWNALRSTAAEFMHRVKASQKPAESAAAQEEQP